MYIILFSHVLYVFQSCMRSMSDEGLRVMIVTNRIARARECFWELRIKDVSYNKKTTWILQGLASKWNSNLVEEWIRSSTYHLSGLLLNLRHRKLIFYLLASA